jgi:predicted ATPase/transcriptional regulator with XRE-family HTH domain
MDRGERPKSSPEFGALLRHHRLAANLSQEALAERARISVNGLGSLERGDRRNPRRETLDLLSDALELSAEQRSQFALAASLAPDARRRQAVAVGPWPSPAVESLPFALTSFVGRDNELAEITALVGAHRMVTLTGAGGVGKTQTALHVALAVEESSHGPACFIGLAPIGNPSHVVAAIASALGAQEVPNRLLLETLAAFLKNRALFLILDNCEHVIAEAAFAAESLLKACPRIRILATSREPLRAAGEYAYKLPTLALPSLDAGRALHAGHAAIRFGAIRLFEDRASAVDRTFALTDDNAPVIAKICRRLDGIPLAIELAAARVVQLSLKAIAEKLDDCFGMLTQGSRTALPRQQTMRATVEWSYNLLSTREQRVFERLSIFAGGCALDVATSVCRNDDGDGAKDADDVFDALSSLISKSLLTADPEKSETRYVLFESFRQYAGAKLAERGEYEMVAHRHALAYWNLAHRCGGSYMPADALPRERIEEELDNWRAALHWTLNDRGDTLLGQRLAGASFGVWQDRSVEGRAWINTAIRSIDDRTPASAIADLRFAEAFVAWQLWECETELAAGEAAVQHYRSIGNSLGIARSQDLTAHALINLGRVSEAKRALLEGIEIARQTGDLVLVAFMLRNLACASGAENDFVAARDYIEQALSIYRTLPDTHGENQLRIAWATSDRAMLEDEAGNHEMALELITGLLDAPRIPILWRVICNVLLLAAGILRMLGRYDESDEYAHEALDLHRRHRLQPATAWLFLGYAMTIAYRPYANAEQLYSAHVRAAKIVGFGDASLSVLGASRTPEGVAEHGRLLDVLRTSFGPEMLAMHMAFGATMDEDRAVELALEKAG